MTLASDVKKVRKYSGPPKGTQEAKDRMARVRAAQWAKNGLVVSNPPSDEGSVSSPPSYTGTANGN